MQTITSLTKLSAVLGIMAATTACAGGDARSPILDFDPSQSSLAATPDTALADGTAEITLTAQVNDADGKGIPMLGVRFTVSGSGNMLTPPSALTNASGVATVVVTSTEAGVKDVTALVDADGKQAGFASGITITFTPTSVPATKLAFGTQPSTSSAGTVIAPPITVLVQDENGDTVAGDTSAVTLAIGTNPASGSLSGTATVDAVDGVATFSGLSVDKIGAGYTLAASSGALTSATSNAFDITAGAAAALQVTVQPSAATAGAMIAPAIEVRVVDAGGNPVTSATNAITATIGTNPSSGVLSGTSAVSATSGVASFADLSIDKAGTGYTLTFSATGLTDATSSAFDISAAAAIKLGFAVQPSNTKAGDSITPAVEIELLDAFDNRVTSATDLIAIDLDTNPGPGTLSGTLSVAAVAGVARFSDLSINRVATGYTLAATSGSLAGAVSNTFAVSHGDPALLSIAVQPTDTTAGGTITPAVDVSLLDGFGNPATTATNTVTMAIDTNPGGGTLSGTTSVAAVAGLARFDSLSIDKTGAGYTLAAASGSLTGATTSTFSITPGSAVGLAFAASPTDAIAGEAIAPAVQVTIVDGGGNVVSSATDAITVAIGTNPGSATLSGTATANAVAGVATFSTLSLDRAGTGYDLTASSGALTGATSSAFDITPAAAAALVVIAPSSATAGVAFDITVEARDAFGNTATGFAGVVDFTSGDSAATLPASYTFLAGDAGSRTFTASTTLATAGTQSLTATDAGGAPPTAGTTNIDVAHGPIATLVFTTQPANALVGDVITPSVVVAAQDAFGNAATSFVGAVTMSIANNPGTATLGGTTSVTASSGVATFDNLSLDATGVGYTLSATDGGTANATSNAFDVLGGIVGGTLVITEVMAAPTAPASDTTKGKWFELRNASANPVRVENLLVEQRPTASGAVEASFTVTATDVIAPGGHYVLGAAAFADNGGVPVDYVYPASFALGYPKHLRVSYQTTVVDEVDFTANVSDNSGGATRSFPTTAAGQAVAHSFQTTSPSSNDYPWYWCNEPTPTPGATNSGACGIAPVGEVDFCRTQLGGPVVLDTSETADVFSQYFEGTVTDQFHDGNDGYANVEAQLGWGTSVTNPEATWTWFAAAPNPSYVEFDAGENNDEMTAQLAIVSAASGGESVFYGFRYRLRDPTSGTSGAWVYCAKEGATTMTLASPGAGGDYPSVTVYPGSSEIAAARAAADGSGLSLPISGAFVTYVRPLIGADPAGFYVQAVATGPALLIEVDPATLTPVPAAGDRVSFTVTDMATFGGMRKATGLSGFTRISTGGDVSTLVQDLSTRADVVTNQVGYEHELCSLASATVVGAFAPDGAGFEAATIDTAGVSGNANLTVRIASTLVASNSLGAGCVLQIGPTPFAYATPTTTFQVLAASDFTVVSCPPPPVCTPSKIVISQVYGGGGNSGATFTNDFIELHNRSVGPVDISGWSVQYASSTGTNWSETVVPASTTLAPGAYYLVQLAGGVTGAPLPTADLTDTTNLSATKGKVALVSAGTPLSGACPTDATIVDFIGYGAAATCSEGANTTGGSNTTSKLRAGAGCTDTDDNSADFSSATPTPRNTSTTALSCGCQ